ncbi:unnamed protein product [Brassica oleracea var. botrytis]
MTEKGRERERREESAEERETVRDGTTDETETRRDDLREILLMGSTKSKLAFPWSFLFQSSLVFQLSLHFLFCLCKTCFLFLFRS